MEDILKHPMYCGYGDTLPEDDDRLPKFREQCNERGFDDSVTWSFDYKLVEWIVPRLERFLEISREFTAEPEFHEIVQEMLDGFKLYISPDFNEFDEEENKKVTHSFELLAQNYRGLWW